jgi:hypothetical protein
MYELSGGAGPLATVLASDVSLDYEKINFSIFKAGT